MMRRSSLNEDLLRRRFSQTSDRLSIALESLTLIPDESQESSTSAENNYQYGSIDNAGGDEDDGDVGDSASASRQQHHRQQHKRISSMAEEGKLLKDELLAMITLAVPVIATYLLEIVPGIITIILVGRMDNGEDTKLYVDAAALAVMYFNIVGLSTGMGLLTALDTLCASAHGANQSSKMGKYLLTAIALMTITLCIVSVAVLNTTNALLFFGQPPSVAHEAGIFSRWMLPGLPFLYAYEMMRKLSLARNETLPMVLSAVMGLLVNVSVGYYLVYCSNWGWLGAALARTLGYMVLFPTLFIGMLYHSDSREFLTHVWSGFQVKDAITKRAFEKFLALGVPGMLQVMFEWCAFEVVALLCGIFPDEDEAIIAIGANAISSSVSTMIFMLYLGASMAGNIRIGNALGAGDPHRAKMAAYLALALAVFLSLLSVVFFVGFRGRLPYLFTADEDLIKKAKDLFLVVALFQIPDAVNGVIQGVFRAIGKQALAAKLNFIAYYIIGIPLGYVLAIPLGIGVEGLWLGMTAGMVFVSTVNTIILFKCDWGQISLEARKRLSIVLPAYENQA